MAKTQHLRPRKATANLELAQSRGTLAEEITTELKESAARTGVYAQSAAEAVAGSFFLTGWEVIHVIHGTPQKYI